MTDAELLIFFIPEIILLSLIVCCVLDVIRTTIEFRKQRQWQKEYFEKLFAEIERLN